jgi:hypothetical protein
MLGRESIESHFLRIRGTSNRYSKQPAAKERSFDSCMNMEKGSSSIPLPPALFSALILPFPCFILLPFKSKVFSKYFLLFVKDAIWKRANIEESKNSLRGRMLLFQTAIIRRYLIPCPRVSQSFNNQCLHERREFR